MTPQQLADKVRAWRDAVSAEVAKARKAGVAVGGALAEIVALNVLHGPAQHYAEAALALLTALGVYRVPNERV